MFKKLPNSTRKFIRFEKARIRRQVLDYKKQEEAISNMYIKILGQPMVRPELSETAKLSGVSSKNPPSSRQGGTTEGQSKKKTNKKLKIKTKVQKNKKGKK